MAPRTFLITKIAVMKRPITAKRTAGSVKVEIAGTTPPLAPIEKTPFSNVFAVASAGATPLTETILSAEAEKLMILAFLKPR